MKIGTRLVCGFLVVSFLSLAIGALSLYSASKIEKNISAIGEISLPYAIYLGTVKSELYNIRSIQRTLLIKGIPEDMKQRQDANLVKSREVYKKAFAVIDGLPLDQTELDKINKLKELINAWKSSNDDFFRFASENNYEKMTEIALHSGRDLQAKALESMDALVEGQRQMAMKLVAEAETNAKSSALWMVVSIVGGFVVSISLGLLLTRGIIKPLTACVTFARQVSGGNIDETLLIDRKDETGILSENLNHMVANLREKIAEADAKSEHAERESENAKVATQHAEEARTQAECAKAEGMLHAADKLEGIVEVINSASEELSAQIEQSSRGSEEQASRVGETATAMEEMNATVLEVAKSASHAAETADQAKSKAVEGAVVVSQVVRGIDEVRNQAQEMMADMSNLGKQAEGIGNIMNVISDIADQTNLLALNAAIEAARAGEAGRGFAVVADEVRKLAEKTMTATKEVGEAIRGIQDGTKKNIDNVQRSGKTIEEATTLAAKSGETLKDIVSLVDSTSDQVRSIATASEQQSATSEEINRSIEAVSQISAETSDAMRQSAQAVTELANQAQILKKLIVEMQADGGGSDKQTHPTLSSRRKALS